MTGLREPRIWSHITDELPEDHPLAFETLYCKRCGDMLHAGYNECMQTWVETGRGTYCLGCFVKAVHSTIPPIDLQAEPGDDWRLAPRPGTGLHGGIHLYVLEEEWGLNGHSEARSESPVDN